MCPMCLICPIFSTFPMCLMTTMCLMPAMCQVCYLPCEVCIPCALIYPTCPTVCQTVWLPVLLPPPPLHAPPALHACSLCLHCMPITPYTPPPTLLPTPVPHLQAVRGSSTGFPPAAARTQRVPGQGWGQWQPCAWKLRPQVCMVPRYLWSPSIYGPQVFVCPRYLYAPRVYGDQVFMVPRYLWSPVW